MKLQANKLTLQSLRFAEAVRGRHQRRIDRQKSLGLCYLSLERRGIIAISLYRINYYIQKWLRSYLKSYGHHLTDQEISERVTTVKVERKKFYPLMGTIASLSELVSWWGKELSVRTAGGITRRSLKCRIVLSPLRKEFAFVKTLGIKYRVVKDKDFDPMRVAFQPDMRQDMFRDENIKLWTNRKYLPVRAYSSEKVIWEFKPLLKGRLRYAKKDSMTMNKVEDIKWNHDWMSGILTSNKEEKHNLRVKSIGNITGSRSFILSNYGNKHGITEMSHYIKEYNTGKTIDHQEYDKIMLAMTQSKAHITQHQEPVKLIFKKEKEYYSTNEIKESEQNNIKTSHSDNIDLLSGDDSQTPSSETPVRDELTHISERVYHILERKLQIEKERRGIR